MIQSVDKSQGSQQCQFLSVLSLVFALIRTMCNVPRWPWGYSMNFERLNLDLLFVAHAKWRRVSQNRHSCQFADKRRAEMGYYDKSVFVLCVK